MKITLLLLLLGIQLNLSQVCDKYQCGILDGQTCSSKVKNPLNEFYTYTLQSCSDPNQLCEFLSATDKNPASCKDAPGLNRAYPGGECQSDSDCITGATCDSGNICRNKKQGDPCVSPDECEIGFSCYIPKEKENKECSPQLGNKELCTEDTDCVNTHGCFNGECTAYFSLSVGTKIQTSKASKYSFCQTGEVIDGRCESTKLQRELEQRCQATGENVCTYKLSNGTTIIQEDACDCGLNRNGYSYCTLGSEDGEDFEIYKNLTLRILSNAKCHTSERKTCRDVKKNDNDLFIDQYTAKIDHYGANLLVGADECVVSVAFHNYRIKPNPKDTCPRFRCAKKEKTCIQVSLDDNNVKYVDLTSCKNKTEHCVFEQEFWRDSSYNSKCHDDEPARKNRFPGEKCEANEDCTRGSLMECSKGTCVGAGLNEECSTTADCLVGHYCKTIISEKETKKSCSPQVAIGEPCQKKFDCVNNALCLNNTCVGYFSQAVGVSVDFPDLTDQEKRDACEFNFVYNNTCALTSYASSSDVVNGLVSCQLDQKCNYTFGNATLPVQECQCGYNPDGLGYCPRAHDGVNKDLWKNYYTSLSNVYNNNCHSMNRDSCPEVSEKVTSEHLKQEFNTNVKYQNAVECARDVLGGASSYLALSCLAFLAMFI